MEHYKLLVSVGLVLINFFIFFLLWTGLDYSSTVDIIMTIILTAVLAFPTFLLCFGIFKSFKK